MAPPVESAGPAGSADLSWLLERAKISDDAQPLIAGIGDGGALVQRLLDAGHVPDALRVLAAALPPREGVWWALTSARHAAQIGGQGGVPPAVTEAIAAAEQWVANPDDGPRRAAWAASAQAGLDTPAGCAAAAPFFANGSVAPPDIAEVPPPPGIYSTLIATAVALAAAADPSRFVALAGAFVAQGLEVVRGLGGWDQSVQLARQHFDAQRVQHEKMANPPKQSRPPAT
ncbi:MAG: DUF6931 family protein [Gemmatimonadaceae bacterium]